MARDIYHNAVLESLIKDGWTITDDPLSLLSKEDGGLQTDLGAEKIITAERGLVRIAVEVKSFVSPSPIHDFHEAFGQYQIYLDVLEMTASDRIMYLAIPTTVYKYLIKRNFIQFVIQKHNIRIIAFNPVTKTIQSWNE